MREGPALTVRRSDYTEPAYWIRSVELTFDLDPAKTIVSSRLVIERNLSLAPQPLKLHGEDITLLRVQANGESVSFRHEPGLLVIDNWGAGGEVMTKVDVICTGGVFSFVAQVKASSK